MNARVYFILGFTFVTGMFAGAYLYVTSFAPEYQQSEVETISEINFKLQGQMVGGCERGGACPSFVLHQNRTYEYIPPYRLQEEQPEKTRGKLDTTTFTNLIDQVQSANLRALQQENRLDCRSDVDGIDFLYRLTYDGKVFELHTCKMNFKNSVLDHTFQPLWQLVSTSTPATSNVFEGGIGEFLKNELDRKFEYDD